MNTEKKPLLILTGPTAVGPVRIRRGFFSVFICSPLYNALKFLFQFIAAHGDNGGTSMRAGVRIV